MTNKLKKQQKQQRTTFLFLFQLFNLFWNVFLFRFVLVWLGKSDSMLSNTCLALTASCAHSFMKRIQSKVICNSHNTPKLSFAFLFAGFRPNISLGRKRQPFSELWENSILMGLFIFMILEFSMQFYSEQMINKFHFACPLNNFLCTVQSDPFIGNISTSYTIENRFVLMFAYRRSEKKKIYIYRRN